MTVGSKNAASQSARECQGGGRQDGNFDAKVQPSFCHARNGVGLGAAIAGREASVESDSQAAPTQRAWKNDGRTLE